jgi:hypothetical protein
MSFRRKIIWLTVSSEHIADSCVPHIIAVKIPNSRPSKIRNIRNTVVAGGENPVHTENK